ncbi:hypothetical protein EIP91_006264 [Steccherinum ochraceum]|uniref:Uncharacterized protein n=1 Tax=Steccherinum ochraceum TaxID=92696 RepID=A0A4R0R5V8_9APHY|nr:hypothetical protein EIP91_006264 [Steccherinum ochraceum]
MGVSRSLFTPMDSTSYARKSLSPSIWLLRSVPNILRFHLTHMHPRRHLQNLLPIELWSNVKDHWCPSDMLSHVRFYLALVPDAIEDTVYGDPRFWERLCLRNGLGCFACEGETPESVDWKKVAQECIVTDAECEVKQCGMKKLAQNQNFVQTLEMNFDSLLDPSAKSMFVEATAGTKDVEILDSVLGAIAFQRVRSEDLTPTTDPYLRALGAQYQEDWDDVEDTDLPKMPPDALLCNHPVAQRSFLTFPPVTSMALENCCNIEVRNPYGITVWDFVQAVQSKLDSTMTAPDMAGMFQYAWLSEIFDEDSHYFDRPKDVGRMIPDVIQILSNMRRYVSLYGIANLYSRAWMNREDSGELKESSVTSSDPLPCACAYAAIRKLDHFDYQY